MKSPLHLDNFLNGLLIAVTAVLLIVSNADLSSSDASNKQASVPIDVDATPAAVVAQTLVPLRN